MNRAILPPSSFYRTHSKRPCLKEPKIGGDRRDEDVATGTPSSGCAGKHKAKTEEFKEHITEVLLHRLKRYSTTNHSSRVEKVAPRQSLEVHQIPGRRLEHADRANRPDLCVSRIREFSFVCAFDIPPIKPLYTQDGKTYQKLFRRPFIDETTYPGPSKIQDVRKGCSLHPLLGSSSSLPSRWLLLYPMAEWKSLLVVAAFVFAMALLEKKLGEMLVGFSAYSAVLVTYGSRGGIRSLDYANRSGL
ncbi:hypothetical protein F5Y11DRAFT_343816 [Daldinia sp. FL1419]|nr:hypothetical protein F5Y11DRAFT_343816 [Daldinia sp. FL1419]